MCPIQNRAQVGVGSCDKSDIVDRNKKLCMERDDDGETFQSRLNLDIDQAFFHWYKHDECTGTCPIAEMSEAVPIPGGGNNLRGFFWVG